LCNQALKFGNGCGQQYTAEISPPRMLRGFIGNLVDIHQIAAGFVRMNVT
jgi:hypothetical protein